MLRGLRSSARVAAGLPGCTTAHAPVPQTPHPAGSPQRQAHRWRCEYAGSLALTLPLAPPSIIALGFALQPLHPKRPTPDLRAHQLTDLHAQDIQHKLVNCEQLLPCYLESDPVNQILTFASYTVIHSSAEDICTAPAMAESTEPNPIVFFDITLGGKPAPACSLFLKSLWAHARSSLPYKIPQTMTRVIYLFFATVF